ncbi:MAG: VOC family protein [Actinobacteria bacterium]|nr:VOC family protein [Actinomycetota bacterium]
MITAVHTLIYSDDPAATRAFFRDVLELPWVSDAGSSDEGADPTTEQSWLIFRTGPSELGIHPTDTATNGDPVKAPRHHQMSLMVDDIAVAESTIRERGGVIESGPQDFGWGVGIEVAVPGTDSILIYQPRHATAYRA